MSFTKQQQARILIPIGLLCVLVGGACLLVPHLKAQQPVDRPTAATPVANTIASTTNATQMTFEVVTSQAAQERGLGGRAVIPDNYAMLFVFPKDDTYGFWMKDMLTPIDMIWLSDNGAIVAINANIAVNTYPNVFYPPASDQICP